MIPNMQLQVGQRSYTNITIYEILANSAESSHTNVATAHVLGGTLEVVAVAAGVTTITVGDETFFVEVTDE